MSKLNVKAFGLAAGILWAIGVIFIGVTTMFFSWGTVWLGLLASVYIGYQPTLPGIVVGALWAFCDAFIGGILLAWLYNKLSKAV